MSKNNIWGLWSGVGLIVLGGIFLIGQFLHIAIMSVLWPVFILAFGAAFFIGMVAGGRAMGALAIPGSIITIVGLILFFQNLFGLWATWSYAWALIISAVGIGLLIFGQWSDIPDLRRAGRVVIVVGVVMFFVFGLFFELGASLLGLRSPGGVFWALALILLGLYFLAGRPLLTRMSGPVHRSTVHLNEIHQSESASMIDTNFSSNEPVPPARDATWTGAAIPSLSGVRRLYFRAIGDMTIVQGEREALEIDAPAGVQDRIRSEVRGETLEIRYEQDWLDWLNPRYWNLSPIRYTLYVRDLERLDAAGLGNLTVPLLLTRQFDLIQSGTGNVTIQRISANDLNVRQAGLGDIRISGQVERQQVELSGTGSYHASQLDSRAAVVQLSGLGSATVHVLDSLDARVSGTGSIEYSGNPRISQHVSGLGSIRKVG